MGWAMVSHGAFRFLSPVHCNMVLRQQCLADSLLPTTPAPGAPADEETKLVSRVSLTTEFPVAFAAD